MGLSYNEIVEKIKSKGLSDEEIQKKVKHKLDQLSGLISKEGAVQIIANELGIKIFRDVGKLKVSEIRAGMRDIEVDGKIKVLYGVKSFKNEKREGKVASLMVGDETGQMRVVLWDANHIAKIENGDLKEGEILKIKNTYCRDNNGFKELHLNSNSELILNPDGISITNVANNHASLDFAHKPILGLTETDRNVMLRGTIVQVFEPKFYEVCERCGKRAVIDGGVYRCGEHGIVNVKYASVLNFSLDDGTENIRVACFRDVVAKTMGVSDEQLMEIKDNPSKFGTIKDNVLGRQLEVSGRVTKNGMFNRIEFVANNIEELKPEKLL